jgi:hypothetical protein
MKTKLITRIFTGILFLSISWVLFLAGRTFMVEKPIENLKHIPDDANFAVRIDGGSFLKTSLFSVLMESKDQEIINAFNEQINDRRKSTDKSKELGINYLSDVVLFGYREEKGEVYGLSVNLSKPKLLRKNASRALSKNQVYAIQGDVGVILSYSGAKDLTPNMRRALRSKAQKIANNKQTSPIGKNISIRNSEKIVQMSSQGCFFGISTMFVGTTVDVNLNKKSVGLNGELFLNPKMPDAFSQVNHTLKPSGFHFFSALIPQKIQDTLHGIFKSVDLNLPKIESISLNYRSLNIKNTMQGIDWTPDIDLMISFDEPIDIKDKILNSEFLNKIGWSYEDNKFKNKYTSYYLIKVNDRTFIFSQNKNLKSQKNPLDCMFTVNGELSSLTNLDGDPFLMSFIQMLAVYKSSKELFGKMEDVNVSIYNTHDNKAELKGQIKFQDGAYPISELLKFGLKSSLIRVN